MQIYIATTNPGKVRDFRLAAAELAASGPMLPQVPLLGDRFPAPRALEENQQQAFAPDHFNIEVLPNLKDMATPEETGATFLANASLKAIFYSQQAPGLWVLADDSGLEVDALDGRPGVRSARFAQDLGAFDEALGLDGSNNAALQLAMLEQTDRRARYRCVLALARDGTVHTTAEGTVEGEVLSDPEGTGGFGYDPLFHVPELNRTMAQVTTEDRLRFSHRGRALQHLLLQLAQNPR